MYLQPLQDLYTGICHCEKKAVLDQELCSCGKCMSMPGGRVAASYRVAVIKRRPGSRDHASALSIAVIDRPRSTSPPYLKAKAQDLELDSVSQVKIKGALIPSALCRSKFNVRTMEHSSSTPVGDQIHLHPRECDTRSAAHYTSALSPTLCRTATVVRILKKVLDCSVSNLKPARNCIRGSHGATSSCDGRVPSPRIPRRVAGREGLSFSIGLMEL